MSSPLREHVFSCGNLPCRLLGSLPRGSPRRQAAAGRAVSSSSSSTVCLVLRMRLWLRRESCIRCFGGGARCCTDDYPFDGLTCLLGRGERHVVQPLRFQYPVHTFCDGVLIRVPAVGHADEHPMLLQHPHILTAAVLASPVGVVRQSFQGRPGNDARAILSALRGPSVSSEWCSAWPTISWV